ncbi:MAG: hypothetical protein ACJ8AD_08410 [Gemmatimonadaceae bacterium]
MPRLLLLLALVYALSPSATLAQRAPIPRDGRIIVLDRSRILVPDARIQPRAETAAASAPQLQQHVVRREQIDRALGTRANAEIRVVRPSGQVALPASQTSVTLKPGEWIVRKTADTAVLAPQVSRNPASEGSSRTLAGVLPVEYLTVDSAGTVSVFVPRVVLQGGGLVYDAAARVFRGSAYVGIEDKGRLAAPPRELASPLAMLLTLSRAGDIAPAALAVKHTGLEYVPIQLSTRAADSLQLHVQATGDSAGVDVPLPIYTPHLSLHVAPRSIEGFGLATTQVSVALPPGLTSRDTVLVRLESPDLQLSPSSITAVANGSNTITVRSGMPGEHEITATADGMAPSSQSLRFAWPWVFVSAAIAGILLAGWARHSDNRRQSLGRALVKGAPFGLLAAIAAAIGIDLVGLKLAGQPLSWAAVALIAAFGAWLGRKVFDARAA